MKKAKKVKKMFWVHEIEFIQGLCQNIRKDEKELSVEDICQELYDNGILIRNNELNCWQHWDKEHPEWGAFYVMDGNRGDYIREQMNRNKT